MRIFIAITALVLGLTTASSAEAGITRYGKNLHFVAETSIPAPDGRTVSLCHLVDFMQVMFIPVYTKVEGYALSNDGCTGNMYRDLTAEHLSLLQSTGMIDAAIPAEPKVSLAQLVWGHALLIAGALGLLFKGLSAMMARRGGRAATAAPDTLAIHSLVAMSQVAVADGHIDDREIHQISRILTRLTGQGYSAEQVTDLLSRLNPSPSDLAQVGQDLSEADRHIVLEAALNIAVADGEIHPNEYAVVSELAQRMRVGADAFRSALGRISAHLQTAQPA